MRPLLLALIHMHNTDTRNTLLLSQVAAWGLACPYSFQIIKPFHTYIWCLVHTLYSSTGGHWGLAHPHCDNKSIKPLLIALIHTYTIILITYFHSRSWIPEGSLVPTVTNRTNYIHWINDLLKMYNTDECIIQTLESHSYAPSAFSYRWIPEGSLVPTVTNRANYIHWINDLLNLSPPEPREGSDPGEQNLITNSKNKFVRGISGGILLTHIYWINDLLNLLLSREKAAIQVSKFLQQIDKLRCL